MNLFIETVATLATIIGYYMIAGGFVPAGFAVALLGNVCWMAWGIGNKAAGIIIVNVFMLHASLIGLGVL